MMLYDCRQALLIYLQPWVVHPATWLGHRAKDPLVWGSKLSAGMGRGGFSDFPNGYLPLRGVIREFGRRRPISRVWLGIRTLNCFTLLFQCQFILPHAYMGYVSSPSQQGMSHVVHVQLSLH